MSTNSIPLETVPLIPSNGADTKPALWARAALEVLYFVVGTYIWARWSYHQILYYVLSVFRYHQRTPQLIREDVSKLSKIPRHIAVILSAGKGRHSHEDYETDELSRLLYETGELSAWCLGVGSLQLTVFERTGLLQTVPLEKVRAEIESRLKVYFNKDNIPTFRLTSTANDEPKEGADSTKSVDLIINLISEKDGRPEVVKLAREYAAQAAATGTTPDLTVESVDADLKRRVGAEPDLLITFGPQLDLEGYSPWHLRITELYNLPDNEWGMHYYAFYRALCKFSMVRINLGS